MKPEPPTAPEEKRAVLRARARALARETQAETRGPEALDIVEFRLASETYGVESAFVREVHPLKDYSPLPGTPRFVLGIINVRGQILSVVDLKVFFNLPAKGLGERDQVIILRGGAMEFGILADAVLGARRVPLGSLQAPPPTLAGIGAEYLRGVAPGHALILDAGLMLGDARIVVHQEAEPGV